MKIELCTKVLEEVFFLFAIFLLLSNPEALTSLVLAQPLNSFSYEFLVDENGFTNVTATYRSNRETGSSWIFVPKFSEWTNRTVRGWVTEWSLRETETMANASYYFYQVFYFSFMSDGSGFEIDIQFNVSTAALIIEPEGIFFSPQIGFEKGSSLEAKVVFPRGFNVNLREAIASGSSNSYQPSSTGSNSNYVLFNNIPRTENLMRIEIGFRTLNKTSEPLKFENGIFTFETVSRYAEYAYKILNLYNRTYGDLVNLFNTTLVSAQVRFFLPDFNSLLAIRGYVPFSSERMGDIYINIVYTRYVEGYIEVIATHELVHHFLWRAGISPKTLLWFHEGMAQYISIETVANLGYEGSEMIRQEIEETLPRLKQTVGENFGFLKKWSPSSQPQDIGLYYTAAYYVVSSLAETHGGLEYYARFFRLMKGSTVNENAALGYYLSLAADESVAKALNDWGFEIPDLYIYSSLLGNVEKVVNDVNPLFQPYKFLAELLYRQALLNAREENTARMQSFLTAAVLIAKLAPLLTLVTVSGVLFGAILLALRREGVFSDH